MSGRLVISGYGICSALGFGAEPNFKALQQGLPGLSSLQYLDTLHAREFPFGEIKKSAEELLEMAVLPEHQGFTRTSLLGILALREALAHAGLSERGKLRTGLLNATSVGGMCEVERYYFDILEHKGDFSEFSDTIDCADSTHKIADYFGIRHFVTTISTACSSSANAIMLGARLLQQEQLDIAICGGADALARFTINGFNSLKNIDRNPCRPFDADRNGLNLGEGAAYLILEREEQALAMGRKPLAVLSGYSNYNEAFHPTAPNPEGEGAFQVMKRALEKSGLHTGDIGYINAHGTATLTNDESESNAMQRLFGKVPRFGSTKCFTGHTLAAAGAIEAVYTIQALQHDCVYANLNFETPMPVTELVPQGRYEEGIGLQHAMSNSFAFGGNNASLIFSRP